MENNRILNKIKQIIREECDGTYGNADIKNWNFATPEESPKVIFEKITELLNLEIQCEDRINRVSQTKPVEVHEIGVKASFSIGDIIEVRPECIGEINYTNRPSLGQKYRIRSRWCGDTWTFGLDYEDGKETNIFISWMHIKHCK